MKLVHAASMLLLLAAALVSLEFLPAAGPALSIVNATPDRGTYHSGELMNITVIVDSGTAAEGAVLHAEGVAGRVSARQVLNLTRGRNELHVTHQLPRCNVCGGISPGAYQVAVTVSWDNHTANATVELDIRQ